MVDLSERLAEINRQNRELWAERQLEFQALVGHPTIFRIATQRLLHELACDVSVAKQTTFEELVEEAILDLPRVAWAMEQQRGTAASEARQVALSEAHESHGEVFRQRARKGGQAEKADPLTRDIRARLRKDPEVTNEQLFNQWEAAEGRGLIHAFQRVDRSLSYFDRKENETSTSFSNLRSRISRERKKVSRRRLR